MTISWGLLLFCRGTLALRLLALTSHRWYSWHFRHLGHLDVLRLLLKEGYYLIFGLVRLHRGLFRFGARCRLRIFGDEVLGDRASVALLGLE